jgi:membrane protein DedA with SNARE-associated domain
MRAPGARRRGGEKGVAASEVDRADMTDFLLEWLASHEGPLAYLVLGLAAALEYVVPPLPGDTITLFGIVLGGRAGYSPWLVYLAIDVGAVAGGLVAYALGRAIDPDAPPRWLAGRRTRAALAEVRSRFAKHGATYLALNRFVPALRAFFFVGAGLARIPVSRVALWGAVSASLWNALLFGVGWAVGGSWQRLAGLASTYAWLAFGVAAVVVVALALVVRARLRESEKR